MSIPPPPHLGSFPYTENPSDMGIPHIDIHEDLFSDHYGEPATVKSELKEYLGNHIPNGRNDFPPVIIENNSYLAPVPPFSCGEGLPYAPIDWPNPGDVWSWRVGKRVNHTGFYKDRFLNVPKSLRKLKRPKVFASKPAVERFIQSYFPDADVNMFFASFFWNVPAILDSPSKGPAVVAEAVKEESSKKTPHSSQRKRTPQSRTLNSSNSTKKQKITKASATPKRETEQCVKDSAPALAPATAPAPPEFEDTNGSLNLSFLDDELRRADFDNYLSSLDDILSLPLSEKPFSRHVLHKSVSEDEIAEARMKLTSFLDLDFPSLICFRDLGELTSLASKVQKDPTLTAEQIVKLKLIEEIPSFCEVFLENREVMVQAHNFLTDLEVSKAKVNSLRQEFSKLKDKATHLQSEVDSDILAVQDIDHQIVQLKSYRAMLTNLIDKKKRDKDGLAYNQKLVASSIPKIVHDVQLANAMKTEWEIKKVNAQRREAEILAKFAPLKGFSF